MTPTPQPENSLFAKLTKVEESILSVFLMIMILLTCVQIALRAFFSTGIPWAEPFLRYLVLWTGFLGAAMATSQGKHIAMDVISFLVPQSMQSWLRITTNLFSAVVAGFLTWSAYLFIQSEMQFGTGKLLGAPSLLLP
jgi:TRAP-type C4-dicarboxylate transport system permease small subunit